MLIRFLPLVFLVACIPPAWEPGDPPLTFSVDSDRTGELVLMGCALWADAGIGLECEIALGDATVRAWRQDLENLNGLARTEPCGFLWTDRDYSVRFDPVVYAMMDADILAPEMAEAQLDRAASTAAHEIGHLLGIWDHLDEPGVMEAAAQSSTITPADIRALPWAGELR